MISMFFSRFSHMVREYFFPEGEQVFFKRWGEVALMLFFATLFIPLKLHAYETSFFSSGDTNPYQTFFLYLSDLFLLGSFFAFSIHFFLHHENAKHLTWGNRAILFFWLLLLTLGEISIFISPDFTLSFLLVLRFLECFFLYLVLINNLVSLEKIFLIIVFGLLGESVLGICQYVLGSSVGLSFLGEPPLAKTMSGVATLMMSGGKILRAYGNFLHPNIFAAYLIFGFFAIKNVYRRAPYPYGIITFIFFFAFLLTFSRTAFFAGLIGFGIYYYLTKRHLSLRTILTMSTVLLILLVSFNVGALLFSRMKFDDHQALQFRSQNFADGVRLALDHPLGVGLGESSSAIQLVVPDKLSPWEYQPPHNLFLVVSSEIGLAGLALFVFLFAYVFIHLYQRRKLSPQVFTLWIALFLLGLTDHYFFSLYHGNIFFTVVLAIAAITLQSNPDHVTARARQEEVLPEVSQPESVS